MKAVLPFPSAQTAGSRPGRAWVVGDIQAEQGRSQAGRKWAGHMPVAVVPLGLRSQAVRIQAAAAYRRRAAVLVGLGIRMRLRLRVRQVDRLEARRTDQHLRQSQNRMLDQRRLSSSCHQLLGPGQQPAVVCRPAPGRIVGRPGKGWPC